MSQHVQFTTVWAALKAMVCNYVSCSLNSLKGGYIGDYIVDYYRP